MPGLFDVFQEELNTLSKKNHRNKKFTERYREDEEFRKRLRESQVRYYERQRDFERQKNDIFLKLIQKYGNEELKDLVKQIELLDELRLPGSDREAF